MLGGIPIAEINQLQRYWQAFPQLRHALFKNTSSHSAELAIANDQVKNTISQHAEVKAFTQQYANAFADFSEHLKTQLITHWQNINIAQQENQLSDALFNCLANTNINGITLIDKYHAYQLLNNQWQIISADLEMLQTEDFAVSKQVDPNMVNKKVRGKDTEVQNGWVGHIMPFELVQTHYLSDELQALKTKQNRLAEISAEYDSILDSLSEEEKEADTIKESGDAFVNAAVIKAAKQLQKEQNLFDNESYEAKIIQVATLINKEKALKKAIKTDTEALHLQTKATIENLNDTQVNELLEHKWITPLLDKLSQLPKELINQLTSQVQTLANKYATTYADIASDIKQSEQNLADLLDELTGNEFDLQAIGKFKDFLRGDQ